MGGLGNTIPMGNSRVKKNHHDRVSRCWVTQDVGDSTFLPVAPSGEDTEGYWDLILQQMRDLKEGGDMQVCEKGQLDPKNHMIEDLTTLRDSADDENAGIIIL